MPLHLFFFMNRTQLLLLIVLGVTVVGGGSYFLLSQSSQQQEKRNVAPIAPAPPPALNAKAESSLNLPSPASSSSPHAQQEHLGPLTQSSGQGAARKQPPNQPPDSRRDQNTKPAPPGASSGTFRVLSSPSPNFPSQPNALLASGVPTETTVEVALPDGVGASLPAAFAPPDPERPIPADQQATLDAMAEDFAAAVQESGAQPSSEEYKATWKDAQLSVDDSVRAIYGQTAYNELHLQAAREAAKAIRASGK